MRFSVDEQHYVINPRGSAVTGLLSDSVMVGLPPRRSDVFSQGAQLRDDVQVGLGFAASRCLKEAAQQ